MKGGSELSELLQKLILTEVHSVYKEIYLLSSNTIFNIFLFFCSGKNWIAKLSE